jgi:4-aminobutyrate aminotransferase-like enzyme
MFIRYQLLHNLRKEVEVPDVYRGQYTDIDAGKKYAQDVKSKIKDIINSGKDLAAFFCESIQGCGGQVNN